MQKMMTDTSHSGEPVSIFSPPEQYLGSIRKLSKGVHNMVLKPRLNAAYEDEVSCVIDGVSVGILRDDQTYYYHRQLSILDEHDVKLVTPCQVTENDVIYFQPLSLVHLKEWVAIRISNPDDPRAQNPVEPNGDRDPLIRLSADQASRVSARIGRHLVHLSSRAWFDPQDAATMARFVYALYNYDVKLDGRLSPRQEDALVSAGYALHRAAPHLLDYDTRVVIGTDNFSQSVLAPSIVISDLSSVEEIVECSAEAQSVVKRMVLESQKYNPTSSSDASADVSSVRFTKSDVMARRQKLLFMVDAGKTLRYIVDSLGVPEGTVRNDLRVLKVDIASVSNKSERNKMILDLRAEGKSIKFIADELSLSHQQVHYALSARLGAEASSDLASRSHWVTEQDRGVAVRCVLIGETAKNIAEGLNVSLERAIILDQSARQAIYEDGKADGAMLAEHIVEIANFLSAEQISANSGIGIHTIRRVGKRAGVRGAWLKTEARSARITESVAMYNSGLTMSEIGDHFGVSREMIRQDLFSVGENLDSMQQKMASDVGRLAAEDNTVDEISSKLRISPTRVKTLADKYGILLPKKGFLYEVHGTIQSYNKGCRCDGCKDANRQRMAAYQIARRDREIPEHVHGTASGYGNWACRCAPCKKAGSIVNKKQLEKVRGREARPQFAWNEEAEYKILDYSKSARVLSEEIGATVASIQQRRAMLLQSGRDPRNKKSRGTL